MLEEVGPGGHISLGRNYAGRCFDVVFHTDGRVELLPMRAPDAVWPAPSTLPAAPDGWRPPGGYDRCSRWALDNREALEAYARQIQQVGTAADQLHDYLASEAAPASP